VAGQDASADRSGLPAVPDASAVRRNPLWALGFALLGMVLFAAALRLPVAGALGGFARGLSVALIEVSLALGGGWLLFEGSRNGLRLYAPRTKPGLWLLAACGCALLLRPLSSLAMQLVPRTGEAPIEAFISWPSGALTFAMLGMVVPLAEELFFRGLLFGALSPLGTPAAAAGTIVLFTAAHAQQSWGNWGALVSVFLTGVVLTTLRALSGSTLVPAVAHVLFNLSLWSSSFGG
jgi:membrane protease YdiL (CAAX protease family)